MLLMQNREDLRLEGAPRSEEVLLHPGAKLYFAGG